MSDSVRPHRQQPTRLCHPWDSPGKKTGVGCHFLLQCMKVKVKLLSRVRLFATPWTSGLPGSSVHGIFQARVLEWVAIAVSGLDLQHLLTRNHMQLPLVCHYISFSKSLVRMLKTDVKWVMMVTHKISPIQSIPSRLSSDFTYSYPSVHILSD